MKKAELQVICYDNEDVIATSATPQQVGCEHTTTNHVYVTEKSGSDVSFNFYFYNGATFIPYGSGVGSEGYYDDGGVAGNWYYQVDENNSVHCPGDHSFITQ